MPPPTVQILIDRIRRCKLLERRQFAKLVHDLQHRFPEPRLLARQLVERAWLTPYQIEELLKDHGSGLVLGQYRLLARLGEGGMGQVFRARHQALGRVVALKVIRKELLVHPDAVRRFRREIWAASKLAHPNVVVAFDADAVNGVHFFAMELADGPDLLQVVQRRGPLPTDLACEYIRQAALGLHHAHERGLIHRDMKPANLLVTAQPGSVRPLVKVLDMGLVRLALGDEEHTPLSESGVFVGTPDFMAPEQAKNSHEVDHRADVYALGGTLYYLLTGRVPFPDCSTIEKMLLHQLEEPASIALFRPDVPQGVVELVSKMMAKQPQQRFQTAAAAAVALASWCPTSWPGENGRVDKDAVLPGRLLPPRGRLRRAILRGFVLLGFIVLGMGGGAFAWRSFTPSASPAPETPSVVSPPASASPKAALVTTGKKPTETKKKSGT